MNRRLITLGVIAALVFAAGAPAAKQPRPARVQASADFVSFNPCAPVELDGSVGARYGHMEINAYDDDQTPPLLDTGLRQNDRISFKITYTDGETLVLSPLAVEVRGDTAYFPIYYWGGDSWTVRDGGNPGTAPSGDDYYAGIDETVDWAVYQFVGSTCGRGMYFLTSGNIKITPAS